MIALRLPARHHTCTPYRRLALLPAAEPYWGLTSCLRRHALEHCMCALELIRAGNFCGAETPGLMNDFHDGVEPESSILSVCYHNLAVEHEHLGEFDQALQAYYR